MRNQPLQAAAEKGSHTGGHAAAATMKHSGKNYRRTAVSAVTKESGAVVTKYEQLDDKGGKVGNADPIWVNAAGDVVADSEVESTPGAGSPSTIVREPGTQGAATAAAENAKANMTTMVELDKQKREAADAAQKEADAARVKMEAATAEYNRLNEIANAAEADASGMVAVTVPRSFAMMREGKKVTVEKGTTRLARVIAEDDYAKSHGVVIVGLPSK